MGVDDKTSQSGPSDDDARYTFEQLISDVPVRPDGSQEDYDDPYDDDAHITCVELCNGNLYIGTSSGELIHYVSLPPEDDPEHQRPTFIQASRIEPESNARNQIPSERKYSLEVKQILLLPAVNKACVLCGGTLTFYSLPELTPAFGGKIKQADCNWVGGLDEDFDPASEELANGTVVVICLKQRLRLIRIGEQARKIRDIELPGCLDICRRGDLACVADGEKYALIDVANQQKVDLFPISSAPAVDVRNENPRPSLDPPMTLAQPDSITLSSTDTRGLLYPDVRGHNRTASLGAQPVPPESGGATTAMAFPERSSSRRSLSVDPVHQESILPADKSLPPIPSPAQSLGDGGTHNSSEEKPLRVSSGPAVNVTSLAPLRPHIFAISPAEFLLTTGTCVSEPGVGMFVNHDGDVVRGTIEFSAYPEAMAVDRASAQPHASTPLNAELTDRVMTILRTSQDGPPFLHVQSWSADQAEQIRSKQQIQLPPKALAKPGIVKLTTPLVGHTLAMPKVTSLLSLRRFDSDGRPADIVKSDTARESEEDKMCARLAKSHASTILFANSTVWWVVARPQLLCLDAQLDIAVSTIDGISIAHDHIKRVFNELRGQEAVDELGFHTLDFIRQKAALLLLINARVSPEVLPEKALSSLLEILVTSRIDPRIVLCMTPELKEDVETGPTGIWIFGGLKPLFNLLHDALDLASRQPTKEQVLQVIKLFLLEWRRKKGYGSVADERHVFASVDSGLLRLLLILDEASPRGPATAGSVRAELNELVDRGVDCSFDKAVEMLLHYRRLYVLSRLYQSRKLVAEVLSTWRRIIEGEQDNGGELVDGELNVRRYLSKIKDVKLVEEYGTWLARRRPALGVQIFADETSRVKFSPDGALALLETKAPNAVKDFLEHLVFDKHMSEHTKTLITFYLDTVLHELDTSGDARAVLTQSYDTYRSLTPPKPTYEHFISDNAIDAEWFRNRLSLLQLIGGPSQSSHYDLDNLSARLEPYSSILVPEMVILSGRRGHDGRALQLLTCGLGDYDTAIRYCLLGGVNVFGSLPLGQVNRPTTAFREKQRSLFRALLVDGLLTIEDGEERLTRTAEVLERYGAWYEIGDVLSLIPEDWPVEALAGLISRALRRLGSERRESDIVKALSGAQNLKQSASLIEKMEAAGIRIESAQGHDSAYHSMESY